ncbi:pilus assembly protein TadG-related protein [Nocardioides sp. GXZ039]|uniref:pilus assembly protein TadG-related protein n=1 Tax=Nocardioides sp. GXZ039 TaxID=3136018 RepID=UPI0030F44E93
MRHLLTRGRCAPRPAESAEERGAIALLAAALIVVILGIAAITVDAGMQRVGRRDMQAIADIVSLDLARLVNGRTAQEIRSGTPGFAPLESARDASVERNSADVVGEDLEVRAYLVKLDDAGEFERDADGAPLQVGALDRPDAVVVVADASVGFGFAPIFGISEGGVARESVGANGESACLRIGTLALGLARETGSVDAVLSEALGTDRLDFHVLVGAEVALRDLDRGLDELAPGGAADLATVPLDSLVVALRGALPATSPARDLLDELANELAPDVAAARIDVAALLGLSQGAGSTSTLRVDVLDLLAGAAFAVHGTDPIAVPGLDLAFPAASGLPDLTDVEATLSVGQRTQVGCSPGTATAESSRVRLEVTGGLDVRVPETDPVARVRGPVRLSLTLADVVAGLQAVTCDERGLPRTMSVSVDEAAPARVDADLSGLRVVELGDGGATTPLEGLIVSAAQRVTEHDFLLDLPRAYALGAVVAASPNRSLPEVTAADLDALGIDLAAVEGPVLRGALNPLVRALDGLAFEQVAPALGLRVSGVTLTAVRTPSCAGPSLVG